MDKERLPRDVIAMRVAKELPANAVVNLGIGIPTLVSNYLEGEMSVSYHSESGVLNYGPLAEDYEKDYDLINAGGQFLSWVPGMSFFGSDEAFAMIRGGHVDVTVLGALQVSEAGDLANWMLPQRGSGKHRRGDGPRGGGEAGHRGDGAHGPSESAQSGEGMHVSADGARVRKPGGDGLGSDRGYARRNDSKGGRARLDGGGGTGADGTDVKGCAGLERVRVISFPSQENLVVFHTGPPPHSM